MLNYGRLAILLIGSLFLGDQPSAPTQPPTEQEKKPAELPPSLPDPLSADEKVLKENGVKLEGPELVEFLSRRTLRDSDRPRIQHLIRLLGSESYHERERTMFELIRRGASVLEPLRQSVQDGDPEISRRAEKCISRIQESDVPPEVLPAVIRMLAQRKSPGAIEALLAFLPAADHDTVVDEIRDTLSKLAKIDGKPSPVLIAGLQDKLPLRRAVAGEALCLAKVADTKEAVRKLLADPDPLVSLRVGLTLAGAGDASAIPVLIDVLPLLPLARAWQAEDLLYRVGEGKNPPAVSLGSDEASRKKCRDAWHAWWQKEGKSIDLAKLGEAPRPLGYTLVILLDENRVVELGPNNVLRWQVSNLGFPLDIQPLPGDRFLVAEYNLQRVTERNFKGEVLWERQVTSQAGGLLSGPFVAQRLPNGNTFISTNAKMIEVDRENKEVMSIEMRNNELIMKAEKLRNGEIVCLTSDARVVRFDSTGKELSSFSVELGEHLTGGRLHAMPNGRVLVPHKHENKVVEYDAQGKPVWEVAVVEPIAAIRLANGNTLVTSFRPERGVVEFDRNGLEVWTYHVPTSRVTRAIRR